MPIYRATFPGIEKSVLIKADSASKAMQQVVTLKPLSAVELAEAFGTDAKLYQEGESIADVPVEPVIEPIGELDPPDYPAQGSEPAATTRRKGAQE